MRREKQRRAPRGAAVLTAACFFCVLAPMQPAVLTLGAFCRGGALGARLLAMKRPRCALLCVAADLAAGALWLWAGGGWRAYALLCLLGECAHTAGAVRSDSGALTGAACSWFLFICVLLLLPVSGPVIVAEPVLGLWHLFSAAALRLQQKTA